jgi:multicomponent Na+:H+ antiporter subunit D
LIIMNNLPALQVVLPLLAAPLCAVIPYRKFAWAFACLVTFLTFVIALNLAYGVFNNGVISYAMGGWEPPIGIEYRVDWLSAFMLVLVAGIGAVTSVYAYFSVNDEIEKPKQPLFYSMFLLCIAGLLGIIITNDVFNIYVFLEISSIATYALIAMGKDRRALIAAFEYLVLGTIGATFILIGIGLLYMMTGTLNISDLSMRIQGVEYSTPIKAGLAFLTVGLILKIAIFPLHIWLANAYTNAPSFVSSFLCGTATKVGIYVLIRVLFCIFGARFILDEVPVGSLLVTIALFSVFAGSLVAIFQNNIKRMLAYSSISQIGYILVGVGLVSKTGMLAAVVLLFSHSLAKCALFMATGAVALKVGGVRIEDFRGLGKKMPITMAAFLIAGLSMISLPLMVGFIGKWILLQALIEKHMWLLLLAVIISSLLSLVYVWRVVEMAYFEEGNLQENKINEAPLMMLVPMWVLVIMTVISGVYTAPLINFAGKISEYLFSL